jgi:hypothetical protein
MGCIFGLQSAYMQKCPHMDAPGIPAMICMCHRKEGEGKGRVYTTVECWKREWIGGKKSVCLGVADGHVVVGRDRSRCRARDSTVN